MMMMRGGVVTVILIVVVGEVMVMWDIFHFVDGDVSVDRVVREGLLLR